MTYRHVFAGLITVAGMLAAAAWLNRAVPVDDIAPTARYDDQFRKYSKRYFSVLTDWRWFKAQSMTESSLRPDVVSSQGAVGLMQLRPGTYAEVMEYDPELLRIDEPRWNIAGGIAFQRYLFDRWGEWVPPEQRFKFALASYNAGLTRVHRVRKRAAQNGMDPDRWRTVAPHAPRETRHYVERVYLLMGRGGPLAPDEGAID